MTVPNIRYQSRAYGLVIESEFPLLSSSQKLSELEVSAPDIKVRSGTIADLEALEENGDSRIWASIPEWGQFFFRDGCEMVVCPDPDISLESLRAVILGSGISILLQQRNLLVLHASSVAINGQAIAFLGNSGWGKSTLVSTLHGKGYTFITDDVLPIHLDTTPPMVMPSYPEVKLLPETLAALGNTFELEDTQFESHWKDEKKITTRVANHSLPLLGLFILRVGDRHRIEPIPIQRAFLELSHHSRAIRMIDELDVPALRAAHFQQCTQLIQQVPCFYLQRRPALEELPLMVELIESQTQALMPTSS